MIFQYTLPQILSGEKTQTRRVMQEKDTALYDTHNAIEAVLVNNKVKWQVGQTYAVQPGRAKAQVARIRITQINSEYVSEISPADAVAEGFADRQEFLAAWQRIHGENSLNLPVWVLRFELVPRGA